MKKFLKGTLFVLLGLVLVLVVALIVHPLWLGPTVKTCAEKIGPKFTGTPIAMANCDINLYGGRVAFDGFALDNPAGASKPTAASVGSFKVVVDPTTVTSDVIVIKEITIKDVYASYIKAGEKMNFDVIAETAAGGEEASAKPTKAQSKDEAPKEEPEKVAEAKPAKKVVIEKLSISGVKLDVIGIPVPLVLPVDINLKDIGKESGGATMAEIGATVMDAVKKALGGLGDALGALGGMGVDAAKAVTDGAAEAAKAATDATKAITEGAADTAKAVADTAKAAAEGAADAAKAVTEGALDGAKAMGSGALDGAKAVGEGALDGAKAVGEGAVDAVKSLGDGLKSLF